uniref:Lipoprotein n=1 Tax=Nitratidesulfovibrio vulgaris (strain DSM 19637 / Miyazaki F) TaxID=883 RepID=B8DQ96_NITV9
MLLALALWLACLGAWRPGHAEPLPAMQRLPVVAPEPDIFRGFVQGNLQWLQRPGIVDAQGHYPVADAIPAGEYAPQSFARELFKRADLTAFPSAFLPVAMGKSTFAALGIRYEAEEPHTLLIRDKPLGQAQVSLTIFQMASFDWDGNGTRDWLFGCRILLYKQNVDLGSFLLVLNPQPTGPLDVRLLRVTYWPSNDTSKYINYFGTAARDYLFTVMRDRLPAIYPGWTPPARAEDLPWRDAPGMEGVGYVEHVDEGKK